MRDTLGSARPASAPAAPPASSSAAGSVLSSAPLSIVTAMLVLAISDNFIALIAERMSVWQFHAMRSAIIMPLIAIAMLALGQARTLRTCPETP
jgi:hypothetical protein